MAEIQTETTVELKLSESEAFVVLRSLELAVDKDKHFDWPGADKQCLALRDMIGCAIEPAVYH